MCLQKLVIFKPKKKHMNFDLKIKVNGKRLYRMNSMKLTTSLTQKHVLTILQKI